MRVDSKAQLFPGKPLFNHQHKRKRNVSSIFDTSIPYYQFRKSSFSSKRSMRLEAFCLQAEEISSSTFGVWIFLDPRTTVIKIVDLRGVDLQSNTLPILQIEFPVGTNVQIAEARNIDKYIIVGTMKLIYCNLGP